MLDCSVALLLAMTFSTAPILQTSAAIPQPCRNAVDGDLDAAQHLLVEIFRAMLLQQLDLHVVQRVKIGKTVADRALKQGVAFQKPFLSRDLQQHVNRALPFAPDAFENALAQGG